MKLDLRSVAAFVLAALLALAVAATTKGQPIDYLGERPPGGEPVRFAPNVVSTPKMEYRLIFSPTGNDIFFCREATLMQMRRRVDGAGWEGPFVPAFCGDHINGEAWFSADGTRLYFCSRRRMPNAKVPLTLWVTEKKDGIWQTARPLGPPFSEQTVHAPSVAANGNIYASGIIRFRLEAGRYRAAEPLSPPVSGHHPCIAPDESFLIFGDRRPGAYDPDLFVVFRRDDGRWTERIGLGPLINTPQKETNASLSPDGRYLFFSRAEDVYWVSAGFIATLRAQALPP